MGKSIQLKNGKALYVLLPVYLFTTKYNGKIYQFAMNGQTGEFIGNIPLDIKKTILIALILFIGSFVLIMLISFIAYLV